MPDDNELDTAIRAVAMLVSYHTGTWPGSVLDPAAAQAAAAAAGADAEAYRTKKNLMVGHDAPLKKITAVLERGRRTHLFHTLPWTIDNNTTSGPRLLPMSRWLNYIQDIAKITTQFNKAVDAFVADYPAASAAAMARLNLKPEHASLYPPQSELRKLFLLMVDFTPIPAGSSFQGLPEGVAEQLEESYKRRMQVRVLAAIKDSLQRAREPLATLHERLQGAPEALTFREPTVDAVRQLPPLIRAWNITGRVEIADLADDIERLIRDETAKTLKSNDDLRAFVIKETAVLVEHIDRIEKEL